MAAVGIASRISTFDASQTDSPLVSGLPIIVHAILCCNRNAAGGATVEFTFEEYGTTTAVLLVRVLGGDSKLINVTFIADKGLQVTTAASSWCTIWHSHPGR